ncbi:MAG TPA: hypothetical protein VEP89_01225 [Draconibacterium sp.]|nr:hypothetical protein [Draconibacterium sp.]
MRKIDPKKLSVQERVEKLNNMILGGHILETFDVVKDRVTYNAEVEIDRSKFDLCHGSNSFFDNLGDEAVNDIFSLNISLALKWVREQFTAFIGFEITTD